MNADRRDELAGLFRDLDPSVLTVVDPLLDELVWLEEQCETLRARPQVLRTPTGAERMTPSARLYRDYLSQRKDISRMLCLQLRRGGEDAEDSPLREYLRTLEA